MIKRLRDFVLTLGTALILTGCMSQGESEPVTIAGGQPGEITYGVRLQLPDGVPMVGGDPFIFDLYGLRCLITRCPPPVADEE